jgi:aubergine-like protein
MSEEVKTLSRAQKRRKAKQKEDVAPASPVAAPAPAAVTPEKAPAVVAPKAITPPKAQAAVSFDDVEEGPAPLSANEVCNRMNIGSDGKPCSVITNTFKLEFLPQVVHRYIVEFEPEIPPERIKQRRITLSKFKQLIFAHFGQNFFDGTTLLGLTRASNQNFGPSDDGSSVHVRWKSEISTTAANQSVQEVNTIVNVMSKKMLRRQHMMLIGRSYFYPEPKSLAVQYHQSTPPNQRFKLKLYAGFNVSVQPCLMGNLMCIDLVSRVMQEQSVRAMMNQMMEDIKNRGGTRQDFQDRAKAVLIGQTVICTYNERPWRIDDVDFTKTMSSTFAIEADNRPPREGKTRGPRGNLGDFTGDISFRDYFTRRYPKLESANKLPPAGHPACAVPGLLVNTPKRERTTKQQTILLPELCYITGLNDQMRSNQSLMKALNQETRLAPSKRVAAISDLIRKVHGKNAEMDATEGQLPIRLSSTPVETKGRVLSPFDVSLPKGKVTLKENKSFSNDIRSCGFFDGKAQVAQWGCVYLKNDERSAQQICATMKKLAGQQAAALGTCEAVCIPDIAAKDSKQWQVAIQKVQAKSPKFILFMVPNADSFIYSVVKNACSVLSSTVSQCMNPANIAKNPKMLNPICGNTLKQILAKLGYHNWRVNIGQHLPPTDRTTTMFVGVDVSHDKLLKGVYGPSRGRRSTVGFVASRNPTFHSFNTYISYQDPDTEFITESQRLMKSALQDYHKENKAFPTSVIIYRDGVGDSQLTTFVRSEIALYQETFAALNIQPKLTVIVVQKRVNLRLFTACPVNARQAQKCPVEARCQGRDKYHSPMAGTIVDNDITSQMLSDFYLVPSIAPPGATARPTRFVVVRDDVGFTNNADALQLMTNQMCYMYFNWPGPIRVPACVMYAHKAAYLFGKHVTGNMHAGLTSNLFYL